MGDSSNPIFDDGQLDGIHRSEADDESPISTSAPSLVPAISTSVLLSSCDGCANTASVLSFMSELHPSHFHCHNSGGMVEGN